MNILVHFWQQIKNWFYNVSNRRHYTATQILDIPKKLNKNNFYLVGENSCVWSGVMLCPCGCQEAIYLNLLPGGHPKWHYKLDRKGRITLHPSIWRTHGCQSHFFLRKGQIEWCNSGNQEHSCVNTR